MDGGVEGVDVAAEALPVEAEELEQPVVPTQLTRDQVPVEGTDAGCVHGQLPDHPVGLVLRAERSELEVGDDRWGEALEERHVAVRPRPGCRVEDAQCADRAPVRRRQGDPQVRTDQNLPGPVMVGESTRSPETVVR